MRLIYHPAFAQELDEAAQWLEKEETGLGLQFIEEVESNIERIKAAPQQFRVGSSGIRRCLLNRFKYLIHFEWVVANDTIYVLALSHPSRKPGYWSSRIRK